MLLKRNSNKSRVIKKLYFSKYLSCADLCNQLDKSLPFMAKLLDELMEDGLIVETGFAPSTGGRRPIMYSLKPESFYIVSVSMDQLITRIALMDTNNHFVGKVVKIDLPLSQNGDSLHILANSLIQFIDNLSINKNNILGIGIGMPGFIEPQKGINHSFLELNEGEESITDFLSDRTNLPVFIDNDSSLIALAELKFGKAENKKNVMVINIGWGVGLGMIINGELYRGDIGFSGEFSHIPLFTNNILCSCGKSGCLETETSLLVLIAKIKEAIVAGRVTKLHDIPFEKPEEAYKMIIKYALDGDTLAVELLSEIGYKIGRGVSILIHLLNPELIVLSGRGSQAGKIWQTPIQQALNEFCIPRLAYNTEISISKLGFEAELIGAAALVIENYESFNFAKKELIEDFEQTTI
jgi:predicted NBD/HSP70 family sugar kinase